MMLLFCSGLEQVAMDRLVELASKKMVILPISSTV